MKKRKGGAFVLIICIMVMVSMFVSVLSIYYMSAVTQATRQRSQIQAYYLAAAGLELGVSMLMEKGVDAETGEEYYPNLRYYAANTGSATEIVDLGSGRLVEITIDAVDMHGDLWINGTSNGDVWVRILAVGTYTNSYGDSAQAGTLRINSQDGKSIVRELAVP